MTPAAIVSKLWNYCNVLRDDGMSYGDYVEQLTDCGKKNQRTGRTGEEGKCEIQI